MLVGERHDESIQPLGLQLLAQGLETRFVGRHLVLSVFGEAAN
jgi:hypothetical protein